VHRYTDGTAHVIHIPTTGISTIKSQAHPLPLDRFEEMKPVKKAKTGGNILTRMFGSADRTHDRFSRPQPVA
jgi:hypothetical protein